MMPQAMRLPLQRRISTVSPRSKVPQTSLMPAGSRLVLRSRSAFAAPSSTTMLPRIERPERIQRLRLSRRSAAAGKKRAERLALGQARQHVRLEAAGDDDVGAAGRREAGGLQLGHHAAGALALAAAGVGLDRGVDALDARRRASAVGSMLRVGGVEALAGHQQHQQVGVDEVGGQRRQRVVLADAALGQLFDRDGVVLVDDRHDL